MCDSEYDKHTSDLKAKELIVTDHPVSVTGDFTGDIQNIPKCLILLFIVNFLTQKIITSKTNNLFCLLSRRIFISSKK